MMTMMVIAVVMIRAGPQGRIFQSNMLARRKFCSAHRARACLTTRGATIRKCAPAEAAGMSAGCGSSSAHPRAPEMAASGAAATVTTAA